MLIGVTLLAILLAAVILAYENGQKAKMTSWFRGLLGSTEVKDAPPRKKQLSGPNATAALERWEAKQKRIDAVIAEEEQAEEQERATSAGSAEGDSTPKARPSTNGAPVPSFTLEEHGDEDADEEEDTMPPPSFPAMNSAQRASAPTTMMPPPPRLAGAAPASNSLMAPPSRPIPALRPTTNANATAGLRVPTTGPLPNRDPTNNSSSLSALSSVATKTPNPRAKVLLTPGHSPLDWAALKRSGKNLSGVPRLLRVAPSQLKAMNGRKNRDGTFKDAWSSYQGKVYNISPYLPFHPGGEGELRRAAGKDGAKLFHEVHPWVNWDNMLEGCLVGILVSEGEGDGQKEEVKSEMDEMD